MNSFLYLRVLKRYKNANKKGTPSRTDAEVEIKE
jgi:hypothetical protein